MKIGLKLGTWYLSLEVIWIILFLFCIINLCIFVKLENCTFGHCEIMSIKKSAVAFQHSESLKLHLTTGVLWLSEIGLVYHDTGYLDTDTGYLDILILDTLKITVWLSSSNDRLGSIFKKCFMTFRYMYFVWAYNVLYKIRSSIMNKYNYLITVHPNPTQQGFRLLKP